VGLAALLLVFATEGLQTAVADGETRTLTFHHTHTGENLTVTFRRNGRYDDAALARLNHFLRDWRNDKEIKMDPRLFDVVWEVYQDVDGKAPIQIISAYRSPATNSMLRHRSRHSGVAQHSQHTLGRAMDLNIPGVPLEKIRVAGLRLQRGGVGFYPTSGSPFVHLDVGSIRHWPRMTHDQLVRVFPDGRTVHIPSDGRPLRGYALALADVERRGSNPSYMSLAAARRSGAVTARAEQTLMASKPKRSILARLFGFGRQDGDDDAEITAATRPASPRTTGVSRRPVEVASAIPMPRARPQDAGPAPMLVASAAPMASAPPTPAQVVERRGVWSGAEAFQPPQVEKLAIKGDKAPPRLVWHVGPQPAATRLAKAAQRLASTRTRSAPALAASPETTGSLPRWPGEPAAEDSPPALALAYAAPEPASFMTRANAAVSPHPAASIVHKRPPGRVAATHAPRPARHLDDNPWLRGMIAAPSVRTSLAVTVVGRPDYRALARMMLKPKSSITNAFADDPQFGLTSIGFSGPAVGALQMVAFGTMTAQLR
jgi:uncharacterized protein YcbK (DUF882 family)